MVVAFTTVGALLGSSVASRPCLLSASGLFIGLVGTDTLSGQSRFTFGVPVAVRRHRRRPGGGRPVRGRRGALRRLPAAPGAGRGHPVTGSWRTLDDPRVLVAVVAAVAARHGDRLPHRHHPRRRRRRRPPSCRTPPRRSWPNRTQGVRARARSRVSPGRRRRTTPRPPVSWCRCSRWACRPRRPRRSSLAAFQRYGIQPGPLLFQNNCELVWALIASLYIGNVMLLVLNLPLVESG